MRKMTVPLLTFMVAGFWGWAAFLYLNALGGDIAASNYKLPAPLLPALNNSDKPEQISILEGLAGQPFLLNFWASWCVTCQAENQFLRNIEGELPIVGIALKDTKENASNWLARFGSPYQTNLLDAEGAYAEILGVQGAPETFLIDGNGNVRFHYQGLLQETVWQTRVKPLLNRLRGTNG